MDFIDLLNFCDSMDIWKKNDMVNNSFIIAYGVFVSVCIFFKIVIKGPVTELYEPTTLKN